MKTAKKNLRASITVPGTHPSIHNSLLLTSTGIPSLDDILGGGLPVGSILLVEEDKYNRFSKVMTKYFLAEGVACGHGLCIVSHDDGPKIIDQLPKLTGKNPGSTSSKTSSEKGEGDMKIAFRYKNLSTNQNEISQVSKHNHYFDISKTMDPAQVQSCDVKQISIDRFPMFDDNCDIFREIFKEIVDHSRSSTCYTVPKKITQDTQVNLMRVAIPSLGSIRYCHNDLKGVRRIAKFLHLLKAVARTCMMVCMVTVPTHLFDDKQVKILHHMSDCAIKLKSFAGEKQNPLFSQYHGLLLLQKLPCLNAVLPYVPQSMDLGFELRRTKFVIEYLNLPPAMEEEAKGNTPCGSGGGSNNPMDF